MLRRRRQRAGLTLVELLIVVALIAIMSAGVIFGSGMLTSSRQRAAATLVVSAVRMGITRANTTGKPVRMVFDLDNHRLLLEESTGVLLREKDKGAAGGADPATEAEQKARKDAERILEGPHAPRAHFSPVKQFGFDGDEAALGRELGKGIRYKMVQTEHDEEERKEGRAYLFFWPGGGTERAVIQLIRTDDPQGEPLSVVVSPLTGRAKIQKGDVKLEAPRNDEEFGELENEP
jgi:general secretion pathway protein H